VEKKRKKAHGFSLGPSGLPIQEEGPESLRFDFLFRGFGTSGLPEIQERAQSELLCGFVLVSVQKRPESGPLRGPGLGKGALRVKGPQLHALPARRAAAKRGGGPDEKKPRGRPRQDCFTVRSSAEETVRQELCWQILLDFLL
jgi:hypothetical protein